MRVESCSESSNLPQIISPKINFLVSVSSWNQNSYPLYDYKSMKGNYREQCLMIEPPLIFYKNKERQSKMIREINSNEEVNGKMSEIARVIKEKDNEKIIRIEQGQASGQSISDDDNYSPENTLYYSLQNLEEIEQQEPNKYTLKAGNIIKFGRIQYRILEIRDNNSTTKYRDEERLYENQLKVPDLGQCHEEDNKCRICFCEEEKQQNPLISPCNCKGSLLKIHLGCLKQWINSKVVKNITTAVTLYNFTKYLCEICHQPYPKVYHHNGRQLQMINIHRPNIPYLILESINTKALGNKKQEKGLLVISAEQGQVLKIGRSTESDIYFNDVSVSRQHALISFANNQFHLQDTNSKFGTLIKIEPIMQFSVDINRPVKLQYGRSLFLLQLISSDNSLLKQEGSSS